MTATLLDAPPETSPRLRLVSSTNPVTRLAAAVLVTAPLIVTVDWLSASLALVLQLVLFAIAGASAGVVVRRVWPVLIAAPVGGIAMVLYGSPSGHEYVSLWLVHITDGSIALGIAVFLRVLAIGVPTLILFLRVDPTELADGLAQIARLPARFVIGTLAAVRLVSLFVEDWRAMALARRARGLGDTDALRRFATMGFALLVLAIRRGSKLATAMEGRGFGAPGPRSWARPSTIGRRDLLLLIIAAAVGLVSLLAAIRFGTFHGVWT